MFWKQFRRYWERERERERNISIAGVHQISEKYSIFFLLSGRIIGYSVICIQLKFYIENLHHWCKILFCLTPFRNHLSDIRSNIRRKYSISSRIIDLPDIRKKYDIRYPVNLRYDASLISIFYQQLFCRISKRFNLGLFYNRIASHKP